MADDVVEQLEVERAATTARIRSLAADVQGIMAATAGANADDEHDPEGSTIAFERAQATALLAQARGHLEDLDRAMTRLAEGSYALCTVCGTEIVPERQAAMPAASTCIRCAHRAAPTR